MIEAFICQSQKRNCLRFDSTFAAACRALFMILSSFSGKIRGRLRLKGWETVRVGESEGWAGLASRSCGGFSPEVRGDKGAKGREDKNGKIGGRDRLPAMLSVMLSLPGVRLHGCKHC